MLSSESPSALVIHDGELEDVCGLLDHLGVPFHERCGPSTPEDEAQAWEIVISTPRRLLEFDPGVSAVTPVRIAIMEKESRTLRSMLHRAGVDLLVRRPVHPEALRLLVLYAMYRGPEKRRSLRVSIGGRVRYRSGIRRRIGVLAELSATGCRLLATDPVERGARIQIQVPGEISGGRSLSVTGSVVRCIASDLPGVHAVAISWSKQRGRIAERLRELVASYSVGPAVLGAGDAHSELRFASTGPRSQARPTAPAADAASEAADPSDRRAGERHEYPQHVIALGVEAARVLLGRDISLGGMRVSPHPDVRLGDELTISVHVRAREKPLVLQARVARDEGENGLVLQWSELSADARHYLTRMVEFLPVIATRQGTDEGTGVVVSEILDHHSPERAAS
ncbi:MAG: PilZ domain-containing protein [Myxococcota bacterium]